MRLPKWLRSVRGKSVADSSSPLVEEENEFGEQTLQTKIGAKDESRGSATKPPGALGSGRKGRSRRRSQRPTPKLPDLETPTPEDFKHRPVTRTFTPPNSSRAHQQRSNPYSRRCPIHGPPRPSVERCTCHGLSVPSPEAPAVNAPASLSLFYATRGGSEESVSSRSVSSFDIFSEPAAREAAIMEQRHIRAIHTVARSIALDPLFQMPLGIDSTSHPALEQSPWVDESIYQHANDLQHALSANLNFSSLSAAWRRGLQAPIESSA